MRDPTPSHRRFSERLADLEVAVRSLRSAPPPAHSPARPDATAVGVGVPYFDETANRVYWSTGLVWVETATGTGGTVGPAGPAGPTGPAGPAGSTGPAGAAGLAGSTIRKYPTLAAAQTGLNNGEFVEGDLIVVLG